MKIFVINLESSTDRKNNVQVQLNKMELTAEFFNAIDGNSHEHPIFKKYDPDLRMKRKGKLLSKGQLGCFTSHFLLWNKCVQLNHPIIVLEDDAYIFENRFLKFLESSKLFSSTYECVRLFDNRTKHHSAILVEKFEGFHIAKFTKGHMRATGYYLTPKGAKKFIRHAEPLFLPVDIYMDRFWKNRVECFGTIPACLTNDPSFDSTIGYDPKKENKSFLVRFNREVFSLCEQFKKRKHNLIFRFQRINPF
jgi:glycosyl transferase, family 25